MENCACVLNGLNALEDEIVAIAGPGRALAVETDTPMWKPAQTVCGRPSTPSERSMCWN